MCQSASSRSPIRRRNTPLADDVRHWPDHGHGGGGVRTAYADLQTRSRLCRLAWTRAGSAFNRRQAAARAHLEVGSTRHPKASHSRSHGGNPDRKGEDQNTDHPEPALDPSAPSSITSTNRAGALQTKIKPPVPNHSTTDTSR